MTTIESNRSPEEVQQRYHTMLRILNEHGYELQRNDNRPWLLSSECPKIFVGCPQAMTGQGTPFQINERSGKFSCRACRAQGNPLHFFAKIWGVTATDARILLDHLASRGESASLRRPPYPDKLKISMWDGSVKEEPYPNTALMTQATRHYAENIVKRASYQVMRYLAKIAVDPESAAAAGVGYSNGEGLTKFLLENGIREDELRQSPLFNENTGAEIYAGRLVFSDLDQTGATSWMFATNITRESETLEIMEYPPGVYGLRQSQKPFLFGTKQVNQEYAIATDDPRVYTVLAANRQPGILLTQRNRGNSESDPRYRKMAQSLLRRRIKALTIIAHDENVRDKTRELINKQEPDMPVVTFDSAKIMDLLNPRTRNLKEFLPPMPDSGDDPD